jgi:hypothetical protein
VLLVLAPPVFLNVAAAAQVVSGGKGCLLLLDDDGVSTHPVATARPPRSRRPTRALLFRRSIIASACRYRPSDAEQGL